MSYEIPLLLVIGGLLIVLIILVVQFAVRAISERQRIDTIESYRAQWGDTICRFLIESKLKPDQRVVEIMNHYQDWGDDLSRTVLSGRILPDMTPEMVLLAWGQPTHVEEKEVTKTGQKVRWTYGIPRRGARYVWFKNDLVTKVEQ